MIIYGPEKKAFKFETNENSAILVTLIKDLENKGGMECVDEEKSSKKTDRSSQSISN